MAQRRFHYELAFEHYLRANAIPYVAVDEAKRALQGAPDVSLKSFDFVVYSKFGANLILDVKGRKHTGRSGNAMQNWVTQEDIDSLDAWQAVFGSGFEPVFVFVMWCQVPPPDMLFHDMYEFSGKWYALLAVKLSDYRKHTKTRSAKWGTVDVPADAFRNITHPLGKLL
jgi:hypothetical protein